jgi:hypothetical protein
MVDQMQKNQGEDTITPADVQILVQDPADVDTPFSQDQAPQTLETIMDLADSAGTVTVPTLSDETGDDLGWTAFTCLIRPTDDVTDNLVYRSIATGTVEIAQDTTKYVGVEYNSGTPQVVARASDTFNNGTDEFLMAVVYNEGGTLHIRSLLQRSGNFPFWTTRRLYEVERLKHQTGLVLGEESGANRYVTMTAGALYSSLEKYSISAFDTSSGADRFDLYYRDAGSSFTKVASQQSWPNAQYDDDSGTLADLTAAYYGNLWFYIETDGHVVCLYGRGDYPTIAEAVAENPPDTLPDRLDATGMLMGRYIFVKSATDPTQIDTAFPPPIGGGTAADHGSLVGLGDDDHGQYAYLAGRTGGQTLWGGPAGSAGSLQLVAGDSSNVTLGVDAGGGAFTILASFSPGTDITLWRDVYLQANKLYGFNTAGSDLHLRSTSHATKGKIYLGANDYYDEVNEELYINSAKDVGQGIESGAAFMGSWVSSTNIAAFAHEGLKATVGSHALLQSSDGHTYLNCATGKNMLFTLNGAQKMVLTTAGTDFQMTTCNINMVDHDITNVDDITGNGGSIFSGGTGAGEHLYLQSTTHATKGSVWADGVTVLKGGNNRCRVHNSGAQTIAHATWTALTFDSERYDPSAMHSTVSNTSRITIANAGIYLIGGNVSWDTDASDQTRRITALSINGVPGVGTEIARQGGHVSTAGTTAISGQMVSTIWFASASDYVELCVFQNSGGNLDSVVAASYAPEFWIQRLV